MHRILAGAAAALCLAASPALAATTFYGPSAYLSAADSPFNPADYGYFYLEDLEDGALNTPGVSAIGPGLCVTHADCAIGSPYVDSVGNGGDGTQGHSLYSGGRMEFTFDAAMLGALPTVAGLVWTDGNNPIHFLAYDQDGLLLGELVSNAADTVINGTTAEDRFFGVRHDGGISRLVIYDTPGLEVDHLQYGGMAAAPEPATWAMMILGLGGVGAMLRRRATGAARAA